MSQRISFAVCFEEVLPRTFARGEGLNLFVLYKL
jgi:hypothetical protein